MSNEPLVRLVNTFMDTSDCRNRLRKEIDVSSEYTRSLKSRYNALAPISRLPPEILTAIFAFLSNLPPSEEDGRLAWIRISHVCHMWRETALDHPLLWSHINLTKLTPVGMAEILARARMAPLHLEGDVSYFSTPRLDAFERQLDAHISHTRHLSLSGNLEFALKRLKSSAPILESLSLSHKNIRAWINFVIPINLFNHTPPSLTSLKLDRCDISWKSPFLKGLRTLKIYRQNARPQLGDWLDALKEMTQLENLVLQSFALFSPLATPLLSSRAVTLSSLTRFDISAPATDCALALAHLVLPALTRLRVDAESLEPQGEDLQSVIPYVTQNLYAVQDIEPIRSILIKGERARAEVLAWTMPYADVKVVDQDTLYSASVSASLVFTARGTHWRYGMENTIIDALLRLLPANFISTLTAQNHTRLSKAFWTNHGPRWTLLEQARLVPTAVKSFRHLLAEDAPTGGPQLPSLTRLVLVDVTLTAVRTHDLRDMLIERVEKRVPLEVLDLRTCVAPDPAIQLLTEIVVGVQGPLAPGPTTIMEGAFFSYSHEGIGYQNEVEYDDGQIPWDYENPAMNFDEESVDYEEPVDYDESDYYDDGSDPDYDPDYDE